MNARNLRSYGLFVALACAAAAPFVACSSASDSEDDLSEDAIVNNRLGLGVRFEAETKTVSATLKKALADGDQLRLKVYPGLPKLGGEKQIDCKSLPLAQRAPAQTIAGKVLYKTKERVDDDVLSLVKIYDDHRWQTDAQFARQQLARIQALGGPKVIVDACVTDKDGNTKARLETTIENAWDQAEKDTRALSTQSLHVLGTDAGVGEGGTETDSGGGNNGGGNPPDQAIHSMEDYGAKCVAELGEIPFFKKLADGKYDTFDCRDFVGTGDGHDPAKIDGVEGSLIPLTVDDQPREKCDGDGPNGKKGFSSYDCVSKCDHAEFLSEGCEVGPTVTHARNAEGSHWVLLCRKVSGGEDKGWLKTKKFDDIAMIGTNPKTGKTCFFQNMIGSGTDGEHVPHPADREKSRTLWDSPKGYCFESCHGTDPFVNSPWIDGAKRANGKSIVPMMGYDPDFEISWLDSPYYVVNMDAQGWTIPKQLVSDEAGPCISCHRAGGNTWMREFANWSTGNVAGGGPISGGDSYWNKITDTYKRFEKSHTMPMRLREDGVTEQTWDGSKWAKAVAHINKCNANNADPSCIWADVPRGEGNPLAPNR